MTKRQKKSLTRIIIAAVLMIILKFLPVEGWLKFVLYMVPYLVVGYDILRKAFKGILNKQVFDENFLMAVATIGAIALGNYKEGVSVMLFYQVLCLLIEMLQIFAAAFIDHKLPLLLHCQKQLQIT